MTKVRSLMKLHLNRRNRDNSAGARRSRKMMSKASNRSSFEALMAKRSPGFRRKK